VIALSRSGLGDEIVIAKIRQAPRVNFDLEVDQLQKLKSSGVSKQVIAAMLDRAGTASGGSPAATTFSPEGKVWLPKGGAVMEVGGVAGYVEASIGQAFKQAFLFSFTNKFAVIARGVSARTRIAERPTMLYSRLAPSEIGIVRFTVQSDNDRRYVWVVSRVGSNAGEFYPPEDNVPFDDEPMPGGVHKLVLRQALTDGEYGLIAPGGNTGYTIYDFAVNVASGG
jgi:hypothetical protein